MSVLQTTCPSCAGQIDFKSGSTIVVVCPFCRSAVARTDRGVTDLGKVAEIAESESPLKLGLRGEFSGNRFELTGRAQMRHELGGFWDEWYATFSNGWVGWLAEAQGRFYLTFYSRMPDGVSIPSFDQLESGQFVPAIPNATTLMVQEKGTATSVAADGEIPYSLTPNEQFQYADLAGKDNAFATIDYSMDPPWVFVGRNVTLADIGLSDARSAERSARSVSSASLSCPNCGGPLDLIAPDRSERVTCPNCSSLLDVNQGNLTYLNALVPPPGQPAFSLSIGASGTINDVTYRVIGAVVRSVTIEGIKYFWHEYLLYQANVGFKWLVQSDNHWNFVESINAADVDAPAYSAAGSTATYNGKAFKVFQDAQAVVEYVQGEFYWRVEQGETVRAVDFVAAPQMLSKEATSGEVNWSIGMYMTNSEVEKAFGISDLPKPWSVAPNQPFTGSFYYTWGLLPVIALLAVAAVMIPLGGLTKTAMAEQVVLQPMANAQAAQTIFSQPFEVKANRNVRISATAPVSNSFAELDVDLINEQSQEVESVNIPIEYYFGSDSDGSWTEGSKDQDATLSSLPGGKYTLRVEGTWQDWQKPLPVSLKVDQNVSRGVNFVCALLILLIVPFLGLIRKFSFESRKWKDSMFTTSGSSDDDE